VLFDFSDEQKTRVVHALLERLSPRGRIVVGSTESLLDMTDRVRRREANGVSYDERV